MTPRILAIALGLSFASSAAFAGDFEMIDLDQSGGLSIAEVQAVAPEVTTQEFAAADVDGSGELSPGEFEAWKASAAEPTE